MASLLSQRTWASFREFPTYNVRTGKCKSTDDSMIKQDHQRFRQIVKGRIRADLRKFITRGELIGKEGKHLISIPVHGIEIPTFRYGDNAGGIGSGEGEEGQTVGQGQAGSGKGQGGEEPGQHLLEVD